METRQRVIDLEHVDKVYTTRGGTHEALSDCNLTVDSGEFVCLVGASGCGKTTLLRIVAGLVEPSSGEVRVDGLADTKSVISMSMVFQQPVLLPWRTNLDNVLLPLEFRGRVGKQDRARAMEMLDLVGLADVAKKRPYELSGGMQQRVSISRALVCEPAIMLMDEPFGALDAMTRDRLNLELQRIWSETGKSILFVTHSIPEAVFLSDRVVVMTSGPGQVAADIDIELERPRTRDHRYSERFGKYEQEISDLIGATTVIG